MQAASAGSSMLLPIALQRDEQDGCACGNRQNRGCRDEKGLHVSLLVRMDVTERRLGAATRHR